MQDRREWFVRRFVLSVALALTVVSPATIVFKTGYLTVLSLIGYFLLIVSSLVLSLMSALVYSKFTSEIKALKTKGLQVQSMTGFDSLHKNIVTAIFKTFLILINAVAALVLFVITVNSVIDVSVIALLGAVVASLISCAGMIYLIPLPKAKFAPGALSKYYDSPKVPMILDNFLADTVVSTMDPATKLRFDEWSALLGHSIRKDFSKGQENLTRLQRAKESLLLLTYLKLSIPEKGGKIFESKIKDVIKSDALKILETGGDSQVSFQVLEELIRNTMSDSPGTFKIIDRMMTTLLENFDEFKEADLWVEAYAPVRVNNYKSPFKLILFVVNKSEKHRTKKRDLQVFISETTGRIETHSLSLDAFTTVLDDFESILSKPGSKKKDVVDLLIDLLQIGEGFQSQILPGSWGGHVIDVGVKENGETVWGESIKYSAYRDYRYYVQTMGSKVAAIGGTLLSAIGVGLSTLLSIVGL